MQGAKESKTSYLMEMILDEKDLEIQDTQVSGERNRRIFFGIDRMFSVKILCFKKVHFFDPLDNQVSL